MSGSVWMFSDQIDDEDMDFMRHEFVTYFITLPSPFRLCQYALTATLLDCSRTGRE